jgi:hypothetical protein
MSELLYPINVEDDVPPQQVALGLRRRVVRHLLGLVPGGAAGAPGTDHDEGRFAVNADVARGQQGACR